MVFGSGGVRIVQDCGESVAGGFAQFYIALDDGVEHQFLEVAFHLVVYLVGLAQPRVIHGQQESLDFECGVQLGLDDFDGVQQFADAFQCKVFGLYGNDNRVGGRERVDCNQS